MKISIFIGVLLGSLACFGAEKTRLKMGVEEIPYLPYFEYAQSQYNGFAKDLLDSFAKDSDLEWVYTGYPVKRLYNNYLKKNSSLDFKFPDHENWQEELKEGHKIFYSRGVISFTDGVMVQKRNLGKVKLKTLGIVRGFTPFDFLPQIRSGQVKVIEANRIEGLLIQAAKGRVDGVYVNIEVAKYLLKKMASGKYRDQIAFDETLPHSAHEYKLSSYKHPQWIQRFSNWLVKNKELSMELQKKWNLR